MSDPTINSMVDMFVFKCLTHLKQEKDIDDYDANGTMYLVLGSKIDFFELPTFKNTLDYVGLDGCILPGNSTAPYRLLITWRRNLEQAKETERSKAKDDDYPSGGSY